VQAEDDLTCMLLGRDQVYEVLGPNVNSFCINRGVLTNSG